MQDILKRDMWNRTFQDISASMQGGSATTGGDNGKQEPMSMQQRVIQSGLDSIKGKDAPQIVTLFKAFAVFPVRVQACALLILLLM